NADLREATFNSRMEFEIDGDERLEDERESLGLWPYLDYLASFSCADLRQADFTGRILFRFLDYDKLRLFERVATDFSGAKLEGAKFSEVSVQVVTKSGDLPVLPKRG